jgi:hypothetical protein
MMVAIKWWTRFLPAESLGENIGEVIRLVPKAERERTRLIREARAMYDRIFPPADPISDQQDMAPVSNAGHTVSGANAHRSDEVVLS